MTQQEGKPSAATGAGAGDKAPGGAVSPAALAPGLHLVATPIGTARDITLRALDTLREADVIAAEDTRNARRLLEIHGIALGGRQLLAYHDHNGARMRPRLIALLKDGARVAYVSDAGTPLVADPGFALARAAIAEAVPVTAAPGPSAVLAALSLSGLPSDRFLFAGFPPQQASARRKWIDDLDAANATVILFESPKRIHRLLDELCERLGAEREAALCRELTKRFEEVTRSPIGALRECLAGNPPRGECVLVLSRPPHANPDRASVEDALRSALAETTVKAAAADVAERYGLARRDVYQMALSLRKADRDHETGKPDDG